MPPLQPGNIVQTDQHSKISAFEKASLYNFEVSRLNFIKELFTKDTMYRLTKEQMFVESLLVATEETGVKMTGLLKLVQTMKTLSPNDLGRGRDEIVKILTPVPVMATLGTAYGEDQPGILSRLGSWITGKPSGDTK